MPNQAARNRQCATRHQNTHCSQARWWRKASADDPQCYGARPWVDEFVRKNPWFVEKSIEDKELDPATLNEIHEQFDE